MFTLGRIELRTIFWSVDFHDSRRFFGGRNVEVRHGALCNRALHHESPHLIRKVIVGGVVGFARHLKPAIDAANFCPDEPGWSRNGRIAHTMAAAAPSARRMVCLSNGILNSVSGVALAPIPSSASAWLNIANVAGLPASADSTAGNLHGIVPTPPAATRTSRITPAFKSTTTAAETTANW